MLLIPPAVMSVLDLLTVVAIPLAIALTVATLALLTADRR